MIRRTIVRINLTDRAKRYRAQKSETLGRKQCGFCGSRRNVEVHHVNGDEDDGDDRNLMWACRKCNTKIGVLMKNAGVGRRTVQYNPSKGRGGSQLAKYGAAIKVMRGEFPGDVSAAVATIYSTPPSVRSAYTARTWKVRKQLYGPSGRQTEIPF
jgi:hypothetical protein